MAEEKKKQPWQLVFLASTSAQLSVCAYLTWLKANGRETPCRGDVCGLLDRDVVNHLLPIPLVYVGLAYAATLLLLGLAQAVLPSRGTGALAYWLNASGSAISLALFIYAYHLTGAFCPWCTAFTMLCLAGFASVSFAGSGLVSRSGALWATTLGLVVSGVSIAFVDQALRTPVLDLAALSAVDSRALWAESLPISSSGYSPVGPRYVVFVDMSCGACRRLVARLRNGPRSRSVRLSFVRPVVPYSEQCARLLIANRAAPCFAGLLTKVLEDDSRAIDPVEGWIDERGGCVGQGATGDEWASATALGISGTPTALRVDGPHPVAVPLDDLGAG